MTTTRPEDCPVTRCLHPAGPNTVATQVGAFTIEVHLCTHHHDLVTRVRRFRDHHPSDIRPLGEHPDIPTITHGMSAHPSASRKGHGTPSDSPVGEIPHREEGPTSDG